MAESRSIDALAPVPDHVPRELVYHFNHWRASTDVSDPYAAFAELDRKGVPKIFYSTANGGHWVVRHYALVHEIFNDHQNFGTYPSFIPPNPDTLPMIPMQIDPPDHGRYKRLLGPLFSPAAARRLEQAIAKTVDELLQPLERKTSCEFLGEYAQRFPQLVFLRLMGMPVEKAAEFVEWAKDFLTGTVSEKMEAKAKIVQFIDEFVEQRGIKPGEDWTSLLVTAVTEEGSSALNRREVLNICYMLFLAGLDTVTNAHAHIWRYLAEHAEVQEDLRRNVAKIPLAIEELLRLFAITNNSRRARHDMDFHGLKLKAGDAVLLIVAAANRDSEQFARPFDAVLDREHNVHLTFGAGIHRCLGSNIARTELRISLEQWLKRVPAFRRGPEEVLGLGGVTIGLKSLPLEWGAAR